jgi:4-hydroxy-tetrahydrodipicolinate synthase
MFRGVYTAIVTPFNGDGSVDYGCLEALVERQAAAGVTGIVPVGTTGESPTLSYEEHSRVIDCVIEAARKTGKTSCGGCGCASGCCRLQVIAGTGANSTSEALELTRRALAAGADGTLQVTPYYNKPSQEGLYRHFSTVADLGLPVVLYNVPGRSAREIGIDTIARLAAHPSVVAVKEAGGSVDRVSQILDVCDIDVLSGDDALTLPMMAVGATGVISVASNVIPKVMVELVNAALEGRWEEARSVHRLYYRLFTHLFLDTNPVPVKAAMAMMGLCEAVYRLPLCEMDNGLQAKLKATLEGTGIL